MKTNISDIITILGLFIGILSLVYAIYSAFLLRKGVNISALQQIRTMINRLEEEKKKSNMQNPELVMHHTQQDLEGLFKSLKRIFNISDKDAPLN